MLKATEVTVAVVVYATAVKLVTYVTAMASRTLLPLGAVIVVPHVVPRSLEGAFGGRGSENVAVLWMGGNVTAALAANMGGMGSLAALAGLAGVSELIGMAAPNALVGGTTAVPWV